VPRSCVPPEVDAFLAEPNPAVVATVRRDGAPHTAPTWYDWEGGRVLLNMDATRLRLAFLRRDPRLALTVLDGDDWYRHVSLLGRAVTIEPDAGLRDIDRLSRRYTGKPYRNRDSARFSAWVEVERWHDWGFTRF
jgi:PPOX class probable F420-dependent enzyme